MQCRRLLPLWLELAAGRAGQYEIADDGDRVNVVSSSFEVITAVARSVREVLGDPIRLGELTLGLEDWLRRLGGDNEEGRDEPESTDRPAEPDEAEDDDDDPGAGRPLI